MCTVIYVADIVRYSGVFRISVKRRRGAVGVNGVRCGIGGWAPSPKKNHFCRQNYKFGCILTQFLTGRKHGVTRSLGTRILRFNRETKLTKNSAKIILKFTVKPKGDGRTIAPPPLNTSLVRYTNHLQQLEPGTANVAARPLEGATT